MKVGMLLIMV